VSKPTSRRWGARLLFLFFALFWGERLVLASCPMHQGAGAHSAHAAHDADAPADQESAPVDACQCLGSCLGGTSVLASSGASLLEVVEVRQTPPRPMRPPAPRHAAPQLRLGLAQGPPTLTVG
jgi:hypothetical protein